MKNTDAILAKILKAHHQNAIDFGTHPNTEGLYASITTEHINGVRIDSLEPFQKTGITYVMAYVFLIDIGLSIINLIGLACPHITEVMHMPLLLKAFMAEYEALQEELSKEGKVDHSTLVEGILSSMQ